MVCNNQTRTGWKIFTMAQFHRYTSCAYSIGERHARKINDGFLEVEETQDESDGEENQ